MYQFQVRAIPQKWYTEICNKNGYADNNTITLLSYLVFSVEPQSVDADPWGQETLVISHRQINEALNMSKGTQITSMKRLEELGVIRTKLVHEMYGMSIGNVLVIEVDLTGLMRISYDMTAETAVGGETTVAQIDIDSSEPASVMDWADGSAMTENTERGYCHGSEQYHDDG